MENNIFGVDARSQFPTNFNFANFKRRKRHSLGREYIANLTGADTKGHGPKRPVGGGMGISAGNSCARLGDALLRTDDMDDPLLA